MSATSWDWECGKISNKRWVEYSSLTFSPGQTKVLWQDKLKFAMYQAYENPPVYTSATRWDSALLTVGFLRLFVWARCTVICSILKYEHGENKRCMCAITNVWLSEQQWQWTWVEQRNRSVPCSLILFFDILTSWWVCNWLDQLTLLRTDSVENS